eukprot:3727771-Pleurochrysis_carterae.AAC.1
MSEARVEIVPRCALAGGARTASEHSEGHNAAGARRIERFSFMEIVGKAGWDAICAEHGCTGTPSHSHVRSHNRLNLRIRLLCLSLPLLIAPRTPTLRSESQSRQRCVQMALELVTSAWVRNHY